MTRARDTGPSHHWEVGRSTSISRHPFHSIWCFKELRRDSRLSAWVIAFDGSELDYRLPAVPEAGDKPLGLLSLLGKADGAAPRRVPIIRGGVRDAPPRPGRPRAGAVWRREDRRFFWLREADLPRARHRLQRPA